MIDFSKASQLLYVVDKSRQWPQLKAIHDAAMAALVGMVPVPEPVKVPTAAESQPPLPNIERKI